MIKLNAHRYALGQTDPRIFGLMFATRPPPLSTLWSTMARPMLDT
jgi:hypothetical protein